MEKVILARIAAFLYTIQVVSANHLYMNSFINEENIAPITKVDPMPLSGNLYLLNTTDRDLNNFII